MTESELGCIGLCDIDWELGLCLGCGRSTDEIYGTSSEESASAPADDQTQ